MEFVVEEDSWNRTARLLFGGLTRRRGSFLSDGGVLEWRAIRNEPGVHERRRRNGS